MAKPARLLVLAATVGFTVIAGAGLGHAQPSGEDPAEVGQPGLTTAVATCANGSAGITVYVDDDRDAPLRVRLDRLRPDTATQTRPTVLDPEHLVHTVTFAPVAAGDYNVHVDGLDSPAEDIPVAVKPCADLQPSDDLLGVEVECKAGWGLATFVVTNPKTGKAARYSLAVDGIAAHVIPLDQGLFLRITENGYEDGTHRARLTGDGVDITKRFMVACESGHAPKLDASTACDGVTGRVSVGVRNPNRRPVEYTLVLRGQTKPVSVAGGERGVITLAGVANGAHPVRVSGRDETEADTVVTVDCAPASATTVTTATITGASGTAAPQPQSRSDVALADTGAAVGGLAGLGALSLGLGGALLITGRWRARRD